MLSGTPVLASQLPVMLLAVRVVVMVAVAVVGGVVAAVSVRCPAASFHGPPPGLLGVGVAGLAGSCRVRRSVKVGGEWRSVHA